MRTLDFEEKLGPIRRRSKDQIKFRENQGEDKTKGVVIFHGELDRLAVKSFDRQDSLARRNIVIDPNSTKKEREKNRFPTKKKKPLKKQKLSEFTGRKNDSLQVEAAVQKNLRQARDLNFRAATKFVDPNYLDFD